MSYGIQHAFPEGGNLPVRAQGSRWISFKRKALQLIINRYGAYINHLSALAEDKTVKTVDRQCLKGYVTRWRDGGVLLGCMLIYSSHLLSSAYFAK